RIDAGEKVMVSDGATATTSDADAVRPLPLSVDDTLPVVLLSVPTCDATTSTFTVQLLPAASTPPAIVTDDEPATAVTVALGHFTTRLLGVATFRPAGNVSVTPTPWIVAGLPAGLVIPIVIVVVQLAAIDGLAEPDRIDR